MGKCLLDYLAVFAVRRDAGRAERVAADVPAEGGRLRPPVDHPKDVELVHPRARQLTIQADRAKARSLANRLRCRPS